MGLPSVLPNSYTLMIVFYISLYSNTTTGSSKSFKTDRLSAFHTQRVNYFHRWPFKDLEDQQKAECFGARK